MTLALLPVGCAATLAPGSVDRAARLAHADGSSSFASALTDLCALVATATSLWLVLTGIALAAVGVRAPRSRWSRRVQRVAPPAWSRVVLAALGVTLLSAPLHACAQSPDPAARPPSTAVAGGASPRSDLSGLRLPDRPSGDARTAAAAPGPDRRAVRVSAGDCLWSIAERALRADGAGRAGHREIAAATRAWYLANRGSIGEDPDLIRPGISLTPPLPPDEGRTR